MKCSEIEYLTPLYGSGELDPPCKAEFEQHLGSCLACARQMEAEKQSDALLKSAVLAQPAETSGLEARVRSQIYSPPERRWRLRWLLPASAAAAAAAAVLLYLGLTNLGLTSRPAPNPAPVAAAQKPITTAPNILADAADDHNEEVVEHFQREWLYGTAQITRLVREKAGDPAVIGELAPAGYHVDRARICELGMRNYVHLVYGDGAHEVSFFVREQDGEQLVGRERDHAAGETVVGDSFDQLQVAAFQSQRYTVVVVSDQPLGKTVGFARKAAGSVRESISRAGRPRIVAGVFTPHSSYLTGF